MTAKDKEPPPKRRALGRGLDALLPVTTRTPIVGGPQAQAQAAAAADAIAASKGVFLCALEKIVPQKGQPRQYFAPVALEELAQSIREHGLLEPIVVRRPAPGADTFEIIAGERRWRASQKAGLREVLVVVKDVSPRAAFELALIENVQREDLNPIELAEALGRLVKEHGYTQESLAERLGKDRTTIANGLRLLKLPARVREKVVAGELSEGHARALLGAVESAQIEQLAEKVIRGKLSVRATEALVRKARDAAKGGGAAGAGAGAAGGRAPGEKTANAKDLEQRLTRALGAKVEVREDPADRRRGEIAIPYADLDMLDRLLDRLL